MKYTVFLKRLKEVMGPDISIPSTFRSHIGGWLPKDKFIDLPQAQDPVPYVTHVPMEGEITKEADEKEAPLPKLPDEAKEDKDLEFSDSGADSGLEDPGMGADVGMGADAGMGMEDPKEQKLSANQIGRVYELKKIYTRLISIEGYLNRATDDETIVDLRKKIGESINLYEVVITNYDQYKENIDEIIIQYYKFLDKVHENLNKYFKKLKTQEPNSK